MGDSILQFLVTTYLYNRFPDYTEGILSVDISFIASFVYAAQIIRNSVVSNEALAKLGFEMGFANYFRYVFLEAKHKQDPKVRAQFFQGVMADVFEGASTESCQCELRTF